MRGKITMNGMTKDALIESLSEYGYPLLEPAPKPERVLEALLEQDDARLLEGFPVVLANILRSGESLGWEDPSWRPEKLSAKARALLPYLLAVSCVLFEKAGLEAHLRARVQKLLAKSPGGAAALKQVQKTSKTSRPFLAGGHEFSGARLENTFMSYMAMKRGGGESLEEKKRVIEQELLLSRLFTPRQKMLLKKKITGESLTKTEREYYSRVLKKRVQALANDDLHAFAKKIFLEGRKTS